VAFDILFLLGGMNVRCSSAKCHQFTKKLVVCMGINMPVHLRYAALRAIHLVREKIASIDAMDMELQDMVLTKLSPAILSTVCPRPGTTLANDPHQFFHHDRDLCYLELIFALARDPKWHSHLFEDHHTDRCISMFAEYRKSDAPHIFYLTGILLRMAPEQLSDPPFDAITEQQWWNIMRSAWHPADSVIDDIYCFEFLPNLVEGTKRHIQIATEYDLKDLVRYVDYVVDALEGRDSEQGEGQSVIDTVIEFRTVVSDMLQGEVGQQEMSH